MCIATNSRECGNVFIHLSNCINPEYILCFWLYRLFSFWLVCWWNDEVVILVNKKSSGTSAAWTGPWLRWIVLLGPAWNMWEERKAFTCPGASSPSTTNGFIFHFRAKQAQLRHFITVAHGKAETGWHRGWMDKPPGPQAHLRLILSDYCECMSSLCHTGRRFSPSELVFGSLWLVNSDVLVLEMLLAGKRAEDLCVATRLSADRTGGRTAGGIVAESIIQ